MNWQKSILPLGAALLMMGCSDNAGGSNGNASNRNNGPSHSNLEQAVEADLKTKIDFDNSLKLDHVMHNNPIPSLDHLKITVSNHKCAEAPEGRYRCTYNFTMKDTKTGESMSDSGSSLLEQRDDQWLIIIR